MTEDAGIGDQRVQPTKGIQIASTEPNHPHLQQDVFIAPFRVWNRFDERVAWVLEYECLHIRTVFSGAWRATNRRF